MKIAYCLDNIIVTNGYNSPCTQRWKDHSNNNDVFVGYAFIVKYKNHFWENYIRKADQM